MARHPGVRPCTSDGAGPEGALWARGPRTDRVARVPDGSRRGCTRRVDWWGLEEVLWTGEKVIYLLLLPSLAYRFFFFVGELKKKIILYSYLKIKKLRTMYNLLSNLVIFSLLNL